MHGWQRTKHNKPLRQLKRIKMLRIDEERWSIVYFKYLIFIFFGRRLGGGWVSGEGGLCVCWLVFFLCNPTLVYLFVSLMGTTCRNVLVKSCIKILWAKTIYFSWHIWISLLNNMAAFIFHQVVMYPPPFFFPLVLQSRTETEDLQSGQECKHARAKEQIPYLPATSKKSVFNSGKRSFNMPGCIEAQSLGHAFGASTL